MVTRPLRYAGITLAACVFAAGTAAAVGQTGTATKPASAKQKPPERPAAKADPRFDRIVREAAAARDARRIDESIKLYQDAVRLRPSWVEGYWHLGTAFYELDRHKEARDAFARVVRMAPKHASAQAFKGLCEFQLKDYETALSDLLNAGELGLAAPKDLADAVTYHTAITLTRLEEYEFALATLQSFARDGTDSPRVIEAFGMALLRIPMVPTELPPHRRELVMLAGRGGYYRAARRPAAAKPAFELLVQRYPDAPNVHYAYGVYLLDEDPGLAIAAFQQELKLSPGHVPAMLQIAFEYLRQSNWDEAKRWAQRVLEIEPGDWPARRAIGQALLETGDVAGSIQQLEAGVKLAPDSPSMRFMLSRAYQRAGRDVDAQRERTEFLRLERLVRSKKHGSQALGGIVDRIR